MHYIIYMKCDTLSQPKLLKEINPVALQYTVLLLMLRFLFSEI